MLKETKPYLAEGEKSVVKKILRACEGMWGEVLDFLDFLVLLYQDNCLNHDLSDFRIIRIIFRNK